MLKKEHARLVVSEPLEQDKGRQIARIDTKTRMALGVACGDFIKIVGNRTAYAITWRVFQSDEGMGIIRLDPSIRARIKTSVGCRVFIEKAVLKPAHKIVLEPIAQDYTLVKELLKEKLKGRPVQNDDCFEMAGFTQLRQRFRLVKTIPKIPVQITEDTEIIIQAQPIGRWKKTQQGISSNNRRRD